MIERGKSYTETINQYQLFVKPSYIIYIEPTKKFADMLISTSKFTDTSKSIDIISTYLKKQINKEGKNLEEYSKMQLIKHLIIHINIQI